MKLSIENTAAWVKRHPFLVTIFVLVAIVYSGLYVESIKPWASKNPSSIRFDIARFDLSGHDKYAELASTLRVAMSKGMPRGDVEKILVGNAGFAVSPDFQITEGTLVKYIHSYPFLKAPFFSPNPSYFVLDVLYDNSKNLSQILINRRVYLFETGPKI